SDIDALVVSHIHLDHAGGAGFLLPDMPRAKVYVHERGFKHLVDPSKLVASAHQALNDDEANLFGTMRPIPPDRLVAVKDQDRLDLGRIPWCSTTPPVMRRTSSRSWMNGIDASTRAMPPASTFPATKSSCRSRPLRRSTWRRTSRRSAISLP